MTRHTSFNETDDVSEVSRRKLWLIFANFLSQHFEGRFTVAFESLTHIFTYTRCRCVNLCNKRLGYNFFFICSDLETKLQVKQWQNIEFLVLVSSNGYKPVKKVNIVSTQISPITQHRSSRIRGLLKSHFRSNFL